MNVNNFALLNENGNTMLVLVHPNTLQSQSWLNGFISISDDPVMSYTRGIDNIEETKLVKFINPTEQEIIVYYYECCNAFRKRVHSLVFEDAIVLDEELNLILLC